MPPVPLPPVPMTPIVIRPDGAFCPSTLEGTMAGAATAKAAPAFRTSRRVDFFDDGIRFMAKVQGWKLRSA